MAGAGYRTWTAGEVVTANNVQTYLQDQTVGVYAGTAARSSAILSPSEGQVSYRTDDDIVEVYDGTNWVPVSAPDTSGLIHINETTIGTTVSSVAVDNVFSSTFNNYKIIFTGRNMTASTNLNLLLRWRVGGSSNSSSNSYSRLGYISTGTSLSNFFLQATSLFVTSVGSGSPQISNFSMDIYSPFLSKRTISTYQVSSLGSTGALEGYGLTGQHNQDVSYDGFEILTSTGTISGGTIQVFGYKD
jgi:hypothetical protein